MVLDPVGRRLVQGTLLKTTLEQVIDSDSAPLSSGAFFSIQFEFSKIALEPNRSSSKAQSRLQKAPSACSSKSDGECGSSCTPSAQPALTLNYATLNRATEPFRVPMRRLSRRQP